MAIRLVFLLLVTQVLVPSANGMQKDSVSSEYRSLVPRHMLALLHAPEVHQVKELRGKVVLVHFYAFQCHNCHANFEIYRRWHDQWHEKGVVVVGIQTPETSQERDPAAVKSAAAERKLEFPIIVDVASKNWDAWGNTMWPTVYVVDKNGYLRQWWAGELNWKGATGDKTIEQVVDQLLAEP